MEVIKQPDLLEFKWEDVTFKIRAKATTEDKYNLDVAMEDLTKKQSDGTIRAPRLAAFRSLVEMFVVDWAGVTDGGQVVPWSVAAFQQLPADPKRDIVLELGAFIANNTGIVEVQEGEKKRTD